jgi:hypothetical protein
MRRGLMFAAWVVLCAAGAAWAVDPTVGVVTHEQLQAVDATGVGTYFATDKVTVTGIILNNPEDILNATPGPLTGYMGGEWQIYIQGDTNDHAGTAVYMAQYGAKAGGSGNYTDSQWLAELARINFDPNTGYHFTAGDRVRVTGWYKFYKGKLNINEMHNVEPVFDFHIELIKPAVGVPQPETIALGMVKDAGDQYIFDPNRKVGCEYYQGRRVRVDDVNVVDPSAWIPNGTITVRDHAGRTFPVKLGISKGFTDNPCPTGQIDVIGIFDQESSTYVPCRDGYRIWVPGYDGNGKVLTDRGRR